MSEHRQSPEFRHHANNNQINSLLTSSGDHARAKPHPHQIRVPALLPGRHCWCALEESPAPTHIQSSVGPPCGHGRIQHRMRLPLQSLRSNHFAGVGRYPICRQIQISSSRLAPPKSSDLRIMHSTSPPRTSVARVLQTVSCA